jgi:hypothetical protein
MYAMDGIDGCFSMQKSRYVVQGIKESSNCACDLSLEQASESYFTCYHVLLRLPYMTQMAEFIGMLVLPYKMLLLCSGPHASADLVSGLSSAR